MLRSPAFDCFTFSPSANLMPGRRVLEVHLVRVRDAPADLVHAVLAADRVRRAVQAVDGRDAAGELAVPGDRVGVDDVLDADLGA